MAAKETVPDNANASETSLDVQNFASVAEIAITYTDQGTICCAS